MKVDTKSWRAGCVMMMIIMIFQMVQIFQSFLFNSYTGPYTAKKIGSLINYIPPVKSFFQIERSSVSFDVPLMQNSQVDDLMSRVIENGQAPKNTFENNLRHTGDKDHFVVYARPAEFGPSKRPFPRIQCNITVADNHACSEIPKGRFNQSIALVQRSKQKNCTYEVQIRNLQNAGALAVIVGDYDEASVFEKLMRSEDKSSNSITIPSFFVTKHSYRKLLTAKEVSISAEKPESSLDEGKLAIASAVVVTFFTYATFIGAVVCASRFLSAASDKEKKTFRRDLWPHLRRSCKWPLILTVLICGMIVTITTIMAYDYTIGRQLASTLDRYFNNAPRYIQGPLLEDSGLLIWNGNQTTELHPAKFGALKDLSGDICMVDGRACDPFEEGMFENCVAVVQRGNCTFHAKSLNLQNAGAIGVIIADTQETDRKFDRPVYDGKSYLSMNDFNTEEAIKIPVYSMAKESFKRFIDNLNDHSAEILLHKVVDELKVNVLVETMGTCILVWLQILIANITIRKFLPSLMVPVADKQSQELCSSIELEGHGHEEQDREKALLGDYNWRL